MTAFEYEYVYLISRLIMNGEGIGTTTLDFG